MKKIIIAITNDIDRDRRMLRTADALIEMGHEVQVVCRNFQVARSHVDQISRTHIRTWFSRGFAFYLEFNIRLFFNLLRGQYDTILSVDTDTLLACTVASKIRKKAMIIDMHELFSEVPELAKKSFKKSIWKSIENNCIPRSAHRYTVSQTIADKLYKRTGYQFEVIRNMPIAQEAKPTIQKRTVFTIAYLGVLNTGRGLEQIIEALVDIPDVELLLIGDGDISAELRALVDRLSLKEKVHFAGWVDPSDVHDHLQSAHVGINLLDGSSTSYYLSLANKYFDYIHAELPILSMNFPEYRMLNDAHRTSVLIDDLDIQNIKQEILNLIVDTNRYNQLKSNCLRAKQEWHWKEESKRFESIFGR